jgi:hypothetical protein
VNTAHAAASSGNPTMVSPRSVADRAGWADFASAKLTPSSRRRDHTTWPCATSSSVCAPLTAHGFDRALHHVSRQRCRVHRIPCPTFVTIAKRPSVGRDAMDTPVIWAEREAEYSFRQIWTGQITLIRFGKLVFARNGRLCRAHWRSQFGLATPRLPQTGHAADPTKIDANEPKQTQQLSF